MANIVNNALKLQGAVRTEGNGAICPECGRAVGRWMGCSYIDRHTPDEVLYGAIYHVTCFLARRLFVAVLGK